MSGDGPSTPATGRLLVSAPQQPRVRRAGDVTSIVLGGLLLLWAVVNQERLGPLNRAVAGLVDVLPAWSDEPLSIVYSFAFLYGVLLLVLLAVGGARHRDALRDVLVATLVAAAIGVVLVRLFNAAWPYVVPELGLEGPQRQTPVFRIAVTTAVLLAASPHLALPLRRLGWTIVGLSAVAGAGLGFGLPSDAVGAVGVGLMAAGATFLVLGAPTGLPDLVTVARGLDRLGIAVTDLRVPASRSWGVRPVLGRAADGRAVVVKVYGRDATDQQLLAKLWRTLWYREQRRSVTFSRLQSVEREALHTIWAERAGVPVPEVLAAGEPDTEVALLVVTTGGQRLSHLDAEVVDEPLLERLWRHVRDLHDRDMAHGDLTTAQVRHDGEGLRIEDWSAASVSASPSEQARDVVSLLYSTAALVGAERAVAAAARGLGSDRLRAALPYLQLPAVSPAARAQAEEPKVLTAALRDALAHTLEEELPEPVELRRIPPRNLALVAMGIAAAVTLVPALGGIDLAAVATQLGGASWTLILLAWVLGQAVFVTEATSMAFATPAPVPFRPLIVLQVAAKLIGVATPGVTGQIAANAAFLSRFGVSPTASLTQGTMDAVAGVLVEVMVLTLTFTFSDLDLGVDLEPPGLALGRLTWLVVAVVVAGAVVVATRPRLRSWLAGVATTMWEAIRAVVADPTRALGLLGGNLATRVVRALVLWLLLRSLGVGLGIGVVLVVVIATGLLQGLVPVPGGIGVAEAVMTGFLVVLGVDEAAAFAATVTYRVIVFYLPILQGGVALRWLTRRGFL